MTALVIFLVSWKIAKVIGEKSREVLILALVVPLLFAST